MHYFAMFDMVLFSFVLFCFVFHIFFSANRVSGMKISKLKPPFIIGAKMNAKSINNLKLVV